MSPGALPNSLQDNDLVTSNQELADKFVRGHIHVVLIGSEDIPAAAIYFGNNSSVDVVCTEANECPTIILSTTVIEDIDEIGQQVTGLNIIEYLLLNFKT